MWPLLGLDPGVGQTLAPSVLNESAGVRRIARAHDLDPDVLTLLEQLPAAYEGAEEQLRKRAVVEEKLPQGVAIDRDVAHRLGDDRGDEDRLPRHQAYLAQEARSAVPDDLSTSLVEHRRLALDDRDERVSPIADAIEHVAWFGGARLSERCKRRQL